MNDTNGSPIHALILAAGEGSRLRKYAGPKPLLQVAGIPLLGRVLRGLKEAGIKKVYIVIGYEGDAIREHIGENYAELNIHYVVARDWEKGNLQSFFSREGILQTEFRSLYG